MAGEDDDQGERESQQNSGLAVEDEDAVGGVEAVEAAY